MLFRNKSVALVKEWIDVIEKDLTIWDQNAFNQLIRQGQRILPSHPNHYFSGYHDSLMAGVLPVALFASGHTYYVQRLAAKQGLKPYGVHATFQYSGTAGEAPFGQRCAPPQTKHPGYDFGSMHWQHLLDGVALTSARSLTSPPPCTVGKRHRMREHHFFFDPPSYYDHPKGFITFNFSIPADLLANGGPRTRNFAIENVVGHFELANHQLKQLRQAFALSSITGRAVVIPEFWCGLDRWWAPHTSEYSRQPPSAKFVDFDL